MVTRRVLLTGAGGFIGAHTLEHLLSNTDWQIVAIPFRPAFSNDWSPYNGECGSTDPGGTYHACCTKAHQEVCVTPRNLRSISQIGVWAEGRAGAFNLVIDRIGAGNSALVW